MAVPRIYGPTGSFLDGLLSGTAWDTQGTNVITWGLWNNGFYNWNSSAPTFFQGNYFNVLEQYINVDFQYVGMTTDPRFSADITFEIFPGSLVDAVLGPGTIAAAIPANYEAGNAFLRRMNLSRSDAPYLEGSVIINAESRAFIYDEPGQIGHVTIFHELGHALGLKHPHDNGFNALAPSLPSFPTFGEIGLQEFDSSYVTVMSYEPPQYVFGYGYPIGPMAFDVAALQYLYGANPTWAAGDDRYLIADTGASFAIWDTGGTDALDASTSSSSAYIDIGQGWTSVIGITAIDVTLGTVIENAFGSRFNDTVYGNEYGNLIDGDAGADIIYAFDGNDIVLGSGGSDIIYGNLDNDQLGGGDDQDTLYGGQQDDTVLGEAGNDAIYGNFQADLIAGGTGDDTLYGGQHNDIILGEDGNDVIFGNRGDDLISGGSGADIFQYNFASDQWVDTITDFNPLEGDQVLITNSAISPSIISYSSQTNSTTITSQIIFDLFEYLPGNIVLPAGRSPNEIILQGGDFTNELGSSILFV